MVSYKPLWETMKEKNITTYTLIYKYNLNPRTINNLLILRILKTGISLEAMPPWVSENGFSSFQAVC